MFGPRGWPVTASGMRATAPVFMHNTKSANYGEGVEPIIVTHGIEWLEKADDIKGRSLPDGNSGVLSTPHTNPCKKEDEPINCWKGASAVGLFTHHEERTSKIENVESAAPIQKAGGVEGMPQQEDAWQTVTRKKNHQKKSSMDKSRNSTQNIPRK